MKRKSYNPFKMWGSYVGAIIGLFLIAIYSYARYNNYNFLAKVSILPLMPISFLYNAVLSINRYVVGVIDPYSLQVVLGMGVVAIYSFIIGWGIQSLIRVLRRK